MNIATTLSHNDFQVKKVLSSNSRSEVFSAIVPFCPVVVIKKAAKETNGENAILNEIQLLSKLKHQNIITIRGARITAMEPFIGVQSYT